MWSYCHEAIKVIMSGLFLLEKFNQKILNNNNNNVLINIGVDNLSH